MRLIRSARIIVSIVITSGLLTSVIASGYCETDTTGSISIVFIASGNSCQSACSVSMHNIVSIADRHLGDRKFRTSVYVTDVRRPSARYYSNDLGFKLQDSLSPLISTLSKGMQQPIAIITGSDERYLVIDGLTQKEPSYLEVLISDFLKTCQDVETESYVTRSVTKCLDSMEINQVQILSDSLLLCFDSMRGEAAIVDVANDTMVHLARLPKMIREQYRNEQNASAWDQYVQMGVKMTQVQLAYVPSTKDKDITLAISQMYFKSQEERSRDTGRAKQVDLKGRMARWTSRFADDAGIRLDASDSTCSSMIGLIGLAPQRINGVTVFSGGTKDYYSANPDSQYVVSYADHSGEHLLIPRSAISHRDSAFNIRGYTFVSAMLNGRLMISHPRNSIFGLFDTIDHKFIALRPFGPLALLCNANTFEKRLSGFIGPDFLVDTARRQFIAVSYASIDPASNSPSLGMVINVYDATTGGHLYSKAFYTKSDLSRFRFKAFHVDNDVLLAISQSDDSTSIIRIRL